MIYYGMGIFFTVGQELPRYGDTLPFVRGDYHGSRFAKQDSQPLQVRLYEESSVLQVWHATVLSGFRISGHLMTYI